MRRATFIVMVDDPESPIRRYYGQWDNHGAAEAYAAPLRVKNAAGQVHAVVETLWPADVPEVPFRPLTPAPDGTRVSA